MAGLEAKRKQQTLVVQASTFEGTQPFPGCKAVLDTKTTCGASVQAHGRPFLQETHSAARPHTAKFETCTRKPQKTVIQPSLCTEIL